MLELLKKMEANLPAARESASVSKIENFEIRSSARCASQIRSAIRNFKRDAAIHAIATDNGEAAKALAIDYINSLR